MRRTRQAPNADTHRLDEASAHVDAATDAQLQATIAEEFASCTVISIACADVRYACSLTFGSHRLRTILGFDLVIVMSDGQVAEMGTPQALFDRQKLFHVRPPRSITSSSCFAVDVSGLSHRRR